MRVMYVEDDPREVDNLSRALMQTEPDVEITTASTVADAVVKLESADSTYSPYDVLLADTGLPDGSGMSLVPLVRDRELPMAVVLLVEPGSEEEALRALQIGASDFVVKGADYPTRVPSVIRDSLVRLATNRTRRSHPVKVLYACGDEVEIERIVAALAKLAPNIHLETTHSGPDMTRRLVESAATLFDVLLIEYRLWGTTAVEILKALRDQGGPAVPVVVSAGRDDLGHASHALRLGVEDFVVRDPDYLRRLPTVLENAHFRARAIAEREKLRASVQTMRAIIDSSPTAIIRLDTNGNVQGWNPAATRMFGWTEAQVIGRPVPFAPGEKVDDFRGLLARTLAGEPLSDIEARRTRRDGTPIDIGISTVPLRDSVNRITGAVWTISDITVRRLNEKRIEQQARLLDFALDAILVRGTDERLLYCNEAAVKLYGYSREELAALPTVELVVPADLPRFENAREILVETGEWEGELRQLTRGGTVITVHSRWSLMRDSVGFPHARLIINRDISGQKDLEKQLRRTQRMESLGALASGIAHDLNNILSPVMMSVDMLRTRRQDPADQQVLRILETSARRGSEGEMAPLQVRHVTREIETILGETFPKNIVVTMDVPKDLPLVLGDATQLHQLILNLCVNSRDALPQGGNLTIRARAGTITPEQAAAHPGARSGPCIVISVTDDGNGIPLSIQDRIFDPFFTTKEKGKGTGLGLATVHSIVQGHGGFLAFESSESRGTRFDVHLPALLVPEKPDLDEPVAAIPFGFGETILVIDDDVSILQIVRQILESYDYKVLSARGGAQAVALAESEHSGIIRLLLTDLDMPAMGGAAAVEAVRRIDREVPVILMSGLPPPRNSPEAESLHIQGIIGKPFKAEDLLMLVRDVLDARGG